MKLNSLSQGVKTAGAVLKMLKLQREQHTKRDLGNFPNIKMDLLFYVVVLFALAYLNPLCFITVVY